MTKLTVTINTNNHTTSPPTQRRRRPPLLLHNNNDLSHLSSYTPTTTRRRPLLLHNDDDDLSHFSSYTTTTTTTCPPTQRRPRSLGGATGAVGFTSDAQAQAFADTIWDLFLGGASPDRPFGAAVLDGYVTS